MYKPLKPLHEVNLFQKRVLIRVDFNVPLDQGCGIADDTRIQAAIPTLKKIIDDKGCCVIISHLGRPHGKPQEKYSLKHIVKSLEKLLKKPVHFAHNCIGDDAEKKAKALKPGEILLLENLRFHLGEETGNIEFAKKLSQLGDVYINDAFGTAHRAHASISCVTQFFKEKYMGIAMHTELRHAKSILENAKRPLVAIIGGSKVSNKIGVISHLLNNIDHLIIGGGMAYTFCCALGGTVGKSLVDYNKLDVAKKLLDMAKTKNVNIHLPSDSIIANHCGTDAQTEISSSYTIKSEWMALDIGPEAQCTFSTIILQAKTILWNGPMGVFEIAKFSEGTKTIGEAVAIATEKGAFSLVGGGDSVAATNQFNLSHKMSYISTGGGALLAYFEGLPLPAVEALK